MNKNLYLKYIKSNAWKKLRKEALLRDNHKCKYCSNVATDVHHISYPDDFKNDKIDNLICLCKKCHEAIENIVEYNKFGVIRQTLNNCVICKRKLKEIDLDIYNNNWICSNCEDLKEEKNE